MPPFGRQRHAGRWVVLVVCIFVHCTCGCLYAFGVYSEFVKQRFSFSQQDLNTIALWGYVGQYTGFLTGFVLDRYGATCSFLIGSLAGGAGFLLNWAFVTGRIAGSLATLSLAYCLASSFSCWFDCASIVTNLHNFHGHPDTGLVLGVLKAFNGLGASVFAQLEAGLIAPNESLYLFLLPFVVVGVGLAAAACARPVPQALAAAPIRPAWLLTYAYAVAVALAGLLAAAAWLEAEVGLSPAAKARVTYAMFGVLLLFWLIPALANERVGGGPRDALGPGDADAVELEAVGAGPACASPALKRSDSQRSFSSGADKEDAAEGPGPEPEPQAAGLSLAEAMCGADLWLFAAPIVCSCGAGLVVISNIAQIERAVARAASPNTHDVLVVLIGVGSAAGRMAMGCVCRALGDRRALALGPVQVGMALVQLWFAFASHADLEWCCVLLGVCYGAFYVMIPALTPAVFGLRAIGSLYAFFNTGPLVGFLALGLLVASRLYDREAGRQGAGHACRGPACYRTAFLVNSACCAAAVLPTALFIWRNLPRRPEGPEADPGTDSETEKPSHLDDDRESLGAPYA